MLLKVPGQITNPCLHSPLPAHGVYIDSYSSTTSLQHWSSSRSTNSDFIFHRTRLSGGSLQTHLDFIIQQLWHHRTVVAVVQLTQNSLLIDYGTAVAVVQPT